MGNLLLINESFELADCKETERDAKVRNFCDMTQKCKNDHDIFYALTSLVTHEYSYGNFYNDFIYKEWEEIIKEPNLKGISSTSHNLFFHLCFEYPSFAKLIENRDMFDKMPHHKGYSGLEYQNSEEPFVKCISSWYIWKISWLSKNQKEIFWKNKDSFLPNKEYSNTILLNEIKKHNKEDKLEKHKKDVAITFHEEVMKYKGRDLIAYTMKIGKMICEANYYIYEGELSKREQALSKSLRHIYSVIGNNGKKQYISLDFRHGMFEFHNSKGEHLGEFHFDGSYNSKSESDHSLKSFL